MNERWPQVSVEQRPLTVWRYMSFARFVWLLDKRSLWLSRSDLLGDEWETSLSQKQIEEFVASESRMKPNPFTKGLDLVAWFAEWSARYRRSVFVNCWTATNDESHAMWRIYCDSPSGVAIKTTVGRLWDSLPNNVYLFFVRYDQGTNSELDMRSFVAQKRPMFAYEQEVRLVWRQFGDATRSDVGHRIDWDPLEQIQEVRVHPESDHGFEEVVRSVVAKFAPGLESRVCASAMRASPSAAIAEAAAAIRAKLPD